MYKKKGRLHNDDIPYIVPGTQIIAKDRQTSFQLSIGTIATVISNDKEYMGERYLIVEYWHEELGKIVQCNIMNAIKNYEIHQTSRDDSFINSLYGGV